jgi:hypothetical protein
MAVVILEATKVSTREAALELTATAAGAIEVDFTTVWLSSLLFGSVSTVFTGAACAEADIAATAIKKYILFIKPPRFSRIIL